MSLTDKDKALRRNLMTGSRIARVAGLSQYGGPLSVYLEMVEGREEPETLPMKRGRILEQPILAWYQEDTGAQLTFPGTIRHPTLERIGATPDALADWPSRKRRVVEAKSASIRVADKFGEAGTDELPQEYIVQTQMELAVTGLEVADVPVLIGGDDFRIFHVHYDADLFGMLFDMAMRFLIDHVDKKTPPPPDATDFYSEFLKEKFPTASRPMLQADEETTRWALELRDARAELKRLESIEKEARNRLVAAIGDAEGIEGDGFRIVYRHTKGRATLDTKALLADLNAPEDLIARHTRVAGYRAFRPTFAKDHDQ